MGYDLHITRRKDWSAEGSEITADEWMAYVRTDPELQPFPVNGSHFIIWSGQSTIQESWLDWSEGCIYSKHPDRALVAKMLVIARHFGATVQGDDGETYTDADESPEAPNAPPVAFVQKRWPFRKRMLISFLAGCVLLILRLLIFGI